ncbi:tRNA modification GTPase GTPBP3, mitochondrial-like protein [Pilobolus umbonatus]|nr:tRNA modification GTPase GTPBP3, mitochondrial-like protein [Pilobolus umbonatus]
MFKPWVRPETIYALSSAQGKAGVAVIRVSGKSAQQVVESMTTLKTIQPRTAYFKHIRHPVTKDTIDRGLVLWFPAPRSFTGEDSVELQIHGGNAVVRGVLDALHQLEDFRMAEQGEFAKRAFENDKLDLTELEGLADLLNAETEVQRKLALRQAEGGLRKPSEQWREMILKCMATTEAIIDFGEDENIEEGLMDEVFMQMNTLRDSINKHLNDSHAGEIVRNGLHVTIAGPPNAGKSTFLNKLAKREAAIVSDIPGTTRDVVEVTMNLGGYPVIVCDTAGLRESEDRIEMEGIKRAKARIQSSDMKICILSVDKDPILDPIVKQVIDSDTYIILNKEDMLPDKIKEICQSIQQETGVKKIWTMSCSTGHGVDLFLNDLVTIIKDRLDDSLANPVLITQARHREHLEDCVLHLTSFLDMPLEDIVLSAEELRLAANALGKITGRINVEDVLDVLFSQFCIGK